MDAPHSPEPSPSQIRLTFAPAYFGNLLSWLFLGFVGMQFYVYTTHFPRDSKLLKLFVYLVVGIMFVRSGIDTYTGYASLVAGWGDRTLLRKPPKLAIIGPAFNAFLGLCVQNFYAWRIWIFKPTIPYRILCVAISMLSILQTIGGIGIPAVFFNVDEQSKLTSKTHVYNRLWLVSGMAADILIVIAMIIILREARSRTNIRSTRNRLAKLTLLTIQTGSLTALLAAPILIFYFFQAKIGLFQTFTGYILGPSYVLSLLANLNFRDDQTEPKRNQVHTSFMSTEPIHFVGNSNPKNETLVLASSSISHAATHDSDSELQHSSISNRAGGTLAGAV